MDADIEKSAMRKIYIRLLPFAILSYFLADMDRINVIFARDHARRPPDGCHCLWFRGWHILLGLFLFEVPSNIVLEKVGARLWIARIMITWGMLAGATAYVTGTTSFGVYASC